MKQIPQKQPQFKPLLMQFKPLWLREKIFYRFFHHRASSFPHLFEQAKLEFAPNCFLKLLPTDSSHQQLAFCGFYELEVTRQLIYLAKKGGCLLDVGANYGYYSCLWASARTENHVLAFEASPRNANALKQNLARNQIADRVSVHEIAVGQEHGSLFFDLGPEEQTGWGGLLTDQRTNSVEVSVITLDSLLLDQYEHIDVLKIDTEGADTWVLQGAKQLLKQHQIHHIFFEENIERMNNLGIQPGEAQRLLEGCGYRLKNLGCSNWHASIN